MNREEERGEGGVQFRVMSEKVEGERAGGRERGAGGGRRGEGSEVAVRDNLKWRMSCAKAS